MKRIFSVSAFVVAAVLGLSLVNSATARDWGWGHGGSERHWGNERHARWDGDKEGYDRRDRKSNKIYITGTVESIDVEKKTFTVAARDGTKTVLEVSPGTEFEIERSKGSSRDFDIKFTELKVKDWVEAKGYPGKNGGIYLKDVNVYRD